MKNVVQSRYPRIPYLRFNGEVPEVPYPGEECCGCRADAATVAEAIHDATPHDHAAHATPATAKPAKKHDHVAAARKRSAKTKARRARIQAKRKGGA